MANKEGKQGGASSWSGWTDYSKDATAGESRPPNYAERNIPDTPMPYTGPPTPPGWGKASRAANLVATLEEGFEPVWPRWSEVVEDPTLPPMNAGGQSKYEFMIQL